MAFFRNNTVNLLNLHYGVHSIALSGGAAFVMAYLLNAGISVPGALMTCAVILFGRFCIRPLLVGLAARFGIRRLVIVGTVFAAAQYPILAEIHGLDAALIGLIVVAAIGDAIYWSTYHSYFASLGDEEHRGQQVGMREAIAAVVSIVSPLATGWALAIFGPRIAFGTTAVVVLLSALPLFWTPEVAVARHVPGGIRAALKGAVLTAGDGWFASGVVHLWQTALFLTLGESFVAFGGALAVAALVGALGGLVLGRYIDAGNGARAVWYAVLTFGFIIVLRALSYGNAPFAVTANALGSLGGCLYIPVLMTAIYNQAKRSPCVLRFHVAAEGGWDIGTSAGLLTASSLIWLGVPLRYCLFLPLLGLSAVFVLLRTYYAANPREVIDTGETIEVMAASAGGLSEKI